MDLVLGSRGMVGSSLCRRLDVLKREFCAPSREELDLFDAKATLHYFKERKYDCVFLAAAKVGGIEANRKFPATFITENLMIAQNVLSACNESDVGKVICLGSSCIYPKFAEQPICEEALLTGSLEPTNEPYAVAKIATIKMCESYNAQFDRDFRCVMPPNLFGVNDSYDLQNSHVIPALIKKFKLAMRDGLHSVELWGTGTPLREFLEADDLAKALVAISEIPRETYFKATNNMSYINVGNGFEISIKELAKIVASQVGFVGDISFNSNFPDGTPRKCMDSSRFRSMVDITFSDFETSVQVAIQDFEKRFDI